jgi:hypothetical protein
VAIDAVFSAHNGSAETMDWRGLKNGERIEVLTGTVADRGDDRILKKNRTTRCAT